MDWRFGMEGWSYKNPLLIFLQKGLVCLSSLVCFQRIYFSGNETASIFNMHVFFSFCVRFDYKLTKVKWAGFSGSKFQVDDMSSLCVFLLLKSLFLSLALCELLFEFARSWFALWFMFGIGCNSFNNIWLASSFHQKYRIQISCFACFCNIDYIWSYLVIHGWI